DGLERIVHAVVDHRVDLDGHVVSAHDALTRHIEGDDPQVDEDPTVEDRDDHRQAGSLRLAQEATEPEDHEPFVFPNHLDRPPQDHEHQDDDQYRRKDEFLSRHASTPRDDKARSANKRVGRDYPAAGRMGRTEAPMLLYLYVEVRPSRTRSGTSSAWLTSDRPSRPRTSRHR